MAKINFLKENEKFRKKDYKPASVKYRNLLIIWKLIAIIELLLLIKGN